MSPSSTPSSICRTDRSTRVHPRRQEYQGHHPGHDGGNAPVSDESRANLWCRERWILYVSTENPAGERNRLKDELKKAHIDALLEAGADPTFTKRSADELIDFIESFAVNLEGKPPKQEQRYRSQLDAWWAVGTVCPNDPASQIEWLEANAGPDDLHEAAASLNIGDNFELLSWVLRQPHTSLSSASFQLVAYVTAGCLGYDLPDRSLMKDVAEKIRSGFYRQGIGLESGKLGGASDRQCYLREIMGLSDHKLWCIPDYAFGPFDDLPVPTSRYVFEGGDIRIRFEEWKKGQRA